MNAITTNELNRILKAMIESADGISDLLFVAGKPPQVEVHGSLETPASECHEPALTGERIENLARVIINGNSKILRDLEEHGSCDCSHSLENICRFRVNIYRQKSTYAMVLRRLQPAVPTLEVLDLPPVFREIVKEKTGLVFITGGSGNGKSTTLAALLNEINRTSKVHIISLEDPVEFVHPQMQSTFSQRELGRDFFNFADGLRAALRQAPKVILVGEIRDRETMEVALIASETGHLVLSTLHTVSADQTINRILGMFGKDEEQQVRERLASSLRYIVGQRLVPKIGGGRFLATELMGSSLRTRETIALGENENRRLHEIIEVGTSSGWHSFEQSLLKAYEQDLITEETALLYSIHKPAMRQRLDIANSQNHVPKTTATSPMMVVPAVAPSSNSTSTASAAAETPAARRESRHGVLNSLLNGLI